MKSINYFTTISFALSLELAIANCLPILASSDPTLQNQARLSNWEAVVAQRGRSRLRFRVPNVRPSGNLEPGAARGGCSPAGEGREFAIAPLLPSAKLGEKIQLYPASTISERPNFFVYIPQTSAQEAKLTLTNIAERRVVYESNFALRGTPGIVKFSLPSNAPALEVGKTYKWTVAVICDANDMSGNPRIHGIVERLPAPQSLANIARVPASDRPALYAEADIWYDAVSSLAQLRNSQPNNTTLAADWSDLLRSVNLDTIADAPLVACCTPKN